MSYNNNNQTANDDVLVLLTWNSTPFKPTTYSPAELKHLRQLRGDGQGFKYFNPVTSNFERPRSMTLVSRKKYEDFQTKSASIASGVSKNKYYNPAVHTKLPAALRLRQQLIGGGDGFSITT